MKLLRALMRALFMGAWYYALNREFDIVFDVNSILVGLIAITVYAGIWVPADPSFVTVLRHCLLHVFIVTAILVFASRGIVAPKVAAIWAFRTVLVLSTFAVLTMYFSLGRKE